MSAVINKKHPCDLFSPGQFCLMHPKLNAEKRNPLVVFCWLSPFT